MLRAMGASVVAMVLMLIIGPPFIRWLRLNEFGQNIREEGPEGHKTKEGTPTMGGVLIWFAVLVPFLIFSQFSVASITVMIAALKQRKSGEPLRATVLRIADFAGLQGSIHIDRFGDSWRPTYITVITNGKFIRTN